MATLRIVNFPEGLNFPDNYKRIVQENETISYILPVDSEMEGFKKYSFGRYFKKDFPVTEPKENGLEQTNITKPINYHGYIYFQENNPQFIFILGSCLDLILEDLLSLLNLDGFIDENIDIATLERISFRSGTVKLLGHKYNKGGTVSFTVRKTDGFPFEYDDPDFISCEEIDKESLEVRLNIAGNQEAYYIYSSGKITRRGIRDTGEDTFLHFYTVYKIIKREISQA